MKKTLVALSVLAAASAQAGFEIYNADGVTVNMGGDIEVVYVKSTDKDSDTTQEIQDADIDFDVRYAVNDDVSVGGFWQFTDVGQSEGDAYVGLYTEQASLKIGRLCTALDEAGIGSDYQFGITTFFQDSEVYCQDEIIRGDYDNGQVYGILALAQDNNGDIALDNDSTYFDGKIGYRVADFDLSAVFGTGTMAEDGDGNALANKQDETLWSVAAVYNGIENVSLAAAYYDATIDVDGGAETSADTIAIAATYSAGVMTYAAGYATSSADGMEDSANWYLNAGYSVAPQATIYAELGGTDEDNTDTGFALGVKGYF